MSLCLPNLPALRRHLDDGAPLPAAAQSHLAECPRCRKMFSTHSAVVAKLTPPADPIAAPPFLHSRVMNAVGATGPDRKQNSLRLAWAIPTLAIALAATFLALNHAPSKTVSTPNTPVWNADLVKTQIAMQPPDLEKPFQNEIKNLQADTLNAARAVASTFLPSSEP
jgi:hypothetical protein